MYARHRTRFADAVTPSYATFKNANASRQSVLYLAANDGMLHAFDARVGGSTNGDELWAYVPRMLIPNLYKLADKNYAAKHQYYVDGSPTVMDAYWAGAWHTVLIGPLNTADAVTMRSTSRIRPARTRYGSFAATARVCAIADADLGYSYGNAVITKRAADGRWVALLTSGYNNVSPGTGQGYFYVLDLATGTVLYKIATGAGSAATPSGLGKIAAWADNFQQDNTAKYVYGGDLRGNVWRFDLAQFTAPRCNSSGHSRCEQPSAVDYHAPGARLRARQPGRRSSVRAATLGLSDLQRSGDLDAGIHGCVISSRYMPSKIRAPTGKFAQQR